jgi:hypothetical protein
MTERDFGWVDWSELRVRIHGILGSELDPETGHCD